eukprot:g2441.t1
MEKKSYFNRRRKNGLYRHPSPSFSGSTVSLPALLQVTSEGNGTGSFTNALISTFKSIFGTGILAFPFAIRSAGLGFGIIGTLIMCLWSFYTAWLIAQCTSLVKGARSYDDVCEASLGKFGKWIGAVNLVIHQILVATAYLVFIAKNVTGLCGDVCMNDAGEYAWWMLGLMVPLFLLCCYFRNVSILAPVSAMGNVAVIVCLAVIIANVTPVVNIAEHVIWWKNPAGLVTFFGLSAFTFSGQTEVVPIYLSMRQRSDYPLVLFCVGMLSLLIFGGFGAIVYAGFGDETDKIIFENLSGVSSDYAKVAMSSVIYLTLPLKMMPAFEVVENVWNSITTKEAMNESTVGPAELDSTFIYYDLENLGLEREEETKKEEEGGIFVTDISQLLIRLILVMIPVIIGIAVHDFGFLVSFVGSFCLGLIGFVLPPIMLVQLGGCNHNRFSYLFHILLAIIGTLACFYCTVQVVFEKINESK